ncbi:MAG: electron transfer flavoprotein subunit beta/FixA family protein [Desulfobacterales bacterium]|jgi:electron transfer flavoprotein beta subunit
MRIYVCVKHVPDSAATITIREKNQIDEGVTFLLNPYDEHAVEEAARLKEQIGNSEVIAVTLGKEGALNTLQSALAMGADRAILIKTDDRPDSIFTARALKAAIEQDGKPDIIFTGKQSIDSEGMQTMFRLATALGMPVAVNVVAFSTDQNKAWVECELEAGVKQLLEIALPCVIGAGKDLNKPRYPTFIDIRKAKKKEIKQIGLDSLPLEKPSATMQILELKPAVEQRQAKELKGPPEEVVEQLIEVLRDEAKVL